MDTKVKLLFFASNPEDVTPLRLDEEVRSITTKIRASEHRDVLDLISRWATRPDDLLQELNTHKPTIVHFSGHGSSSGELVLMDNLRQSKAVSPSALKSLFSTLRDNVRLVVLNACYSKTQAKAIAQVIDCVIGMNASIGDNAAIIFAGSFYRAIGFGRSVKESFEQGRVSLMLEGIPEEDSPELLVREGVDPTTVHLVEPQRGKPDTVRVSDFLIVGSVQAEADGSTSIEISHSGRVQIVPVTLIIDVPRQEPRGYDYYIVFDVTNTAPSELRIVNISVRTLAWEPLEQIIRYMPSAGLGETREFFCIIDKEPHQYVARLGRPHLPGAYIKLAPGELETIQLMLTALSEGKYSIQVEVQYSTAGKTGIDVVGPIEEIRFLDRGRIASLSR